MSLEIRQSLNYLQIHFKIDMHFFLWSKTRSLNQNANRVSKDIFF